MEESSSTREEKPGLSSAKREDIWALVIAGVVMALSIAAPEAVYAVFKKMLYFF
jgi:hypothetical protein